MIQEFSKVARLKKKKIKAQVSVAFLYTNIEADKSRKINPNYNCTQTKKVPR